jgi:chemotaxis protein MotB
MRGLAWAGCATVAALLVLAGCADNPMVVNGRLNELQQQQLALSRQNQELQSRASSLDHDNQELQTALSQARQQNKVLEDEKKLVKDQLASLNAQVARVREEKRSTDQKVQALNASLQRQGNATITPNNSLLKTLPQFNRPDIFVRRDGDVLRIELPAAALFEPGSAQLRSAAMPLLADVALELLRDYPSQVIGIEGHTSSDPISNALWRNNLQFSISQATMVYEVLVNQGRLPPKQLLVVGHGASHPVVSNATPAGKQRNARVELVIYPETAG